MADPLTLETWLSHIGVAPDMAAVVSALAAVGNRLSAVIALGPLGGALGAAVGVNSDGDGQKALDVMADDAFAEGLRATGSVRWFASEEQPEAVMFAPGGRYGVAIDPLDGSSNIDVNVSIGTIFSIQHAEATPEATFLRPGREQAAAGYIVYGPQTALLLTFGKGTALFILDRARGTFHLADERRSIPATSTEFAINASNYRHWSRPIRAYIDDCLSGDQGPRGKNFNMRWVASLVAETHRIMMRGGVFLYPSDSRKGYEHGRLRMIYECAPIALLIEQAGGMATDGCDRLLDQTPTSLHGRTPFVFGSSEKVARVAAYHDLPDAEVSPLFGQRGLFKV